MGLELIVVPESSDKIYINEKVEFNSYIINNKQDRYFMPARNLTEYKKAFDSLARLWVNYATDYAPLVELAKTLKFPFIATNVPRKYARDLR